MYLPFADRPRKIEIIVHSAAASAAAVGAGLAQFPCSDLVPIAAIQTSMISAIAIAHGRKLSEGTVTSMLPVLTATLAGRAVTRLLLRCVPIVGNVANAATAAATTEAIGWAADAFFRDLPPATVAVDVQSVLDAWAYRQGAAGARPSISGP